MKGDIKMAGSDKPGCRIKDLVVLEIFRSKCFSLDKFKHKYPLLGVNYPGGYPRTVRGPACSKFVESHHAMNGNILSQPDEITAAAIVYPEIPVCNPPE